MSELNPVRIAVIGAGAMGRNHIRFVTEEPEAELVAIADAFEGARATAEAAGVPFYTDPAQMMDEVKPEAVIIATPNDLHLGVAREAVKRNIVPLVEKPISNDLEDAQAFAAEAETAGVPVLESVAAIFAPTSPDFPTPQTSSLPLCESTVLTARTKLSSSFSTAPRIDFDSHSSVAFAKANNSESSIFKFCLRIFRRQPSRRACLCQSIRTAFRPPRI